MISRSRRITDLLDPKLLNSLSGLQLVSKVLSEELLSGANISRKTGVGMEFSQYRSYEPGDDLRLLDWKLFGRTERYYVRQAVVYSNIHIRFVLDNTASMSYEEEGLSKIRLASVVIATLSYLAWRSGDYFSFSDIRGEATSMGNDQRHLNRIIYLLDNEKGEGNFPSEFNIGKWGKSLQKEFIIVFSDLYQDRNELLDFIKGLKIANNEVIVFHISGKQEEDFDFRKPLFFKDLETGVKVRTDAARIRDEYLRKRKSYFREIYHDLTEAGVSVERLSMGDDPVQVMKKFLTERNYLHL